MNCTNCGALVPVSFPGQKLKCPECGTLLDTRRAAATNPTKK
jgi:predicted RNA-binding Zn-ribbon protein involved in translation (DUF1610 family)